MKRIIFSTIKIVTIIIFLSSCEGDDSSRFPEIVALDEVQGTLSIDRTASFSGDALKFSLTVSQSFSSNAIVEISAVTNSNINSRALINLPAGATGGEGYIIMPNAPINNQLYEGTANFVSVKLTGIDLEEDDQDTFSLTSEPVVLGYYNYNFDNSEGLNLGLDWQGDATIDIDVGMYTTDGDFSGLSAATLAKPEVGDIDSEDLPDGDYLVLYRSYSDVTGPIQLRTVIRGESTGQELTLDLPSLSVSGGWFLDNVLAFVTKSTDTNGVVSYTYTAP